MTISNLLSNVVVNIDGAEHNNTITHSSSLRVRSGSAVKTISFEPRIEIPDANPLILSFGGVSHEVGETFPMPKRDVPITCIAKYPLMYVGNTSKSDASNITESDVDNFEYKVDTDINVEITGESGSYVAVAVISGHGLIVTNDGIQISSISYASSQLTINGLSYDVYIYQSSGDTLVTIESNDYYNVNVSSNLTDADASFSIKVNGVEQASPFISGTTILVSISGYDSSHYTFDGTWIVNGNSITSDTLSLVVTDNLTIEAQFSIITSFTVSVSTEDTSKGSVSGGGTYNDGSSVTVVATPNRGYTFVRWTIGGETASNSSSYTFTVNKSISLYAEFTAREDYVIITASHNGNGSVAISVNGYSGQVADNKYYPEETINLVASPDTSYEFSAWTLNGTEISNIRSIELNVDEVASGSEYIAIFTAIPPDYYIGFYDNYTDYLNASDDDLINNARANGIVSVTPNYPSSDSYINYENNEKLMYLLYNVNYSVRIDIDNPGSHFDLEDLTPEEIHISALSRNDFIKDNKTYKALATFDSANSPDNGFRFKFTN